MTQFRKIKIACPHCGVVFTTITYSSINAWMDPKLIKEFLDGGLSVECPKCHEKMILNIKILISGRLGGNWILNTADYETKLKKLKEWGALDANGNVIEFMGLGVPTKKNSDLDKKEKFDRKKLELELKEILENKAKNKPQNKAKDKAIDEEKE